MSNKSDMKVEVVVGAVVPNEGASLLSTPLSAWTELPEEKSQSKKEQQQLVSGTGESFVLEELWGGQVNEGVNIDLAQKRFQQPPYPGYPSFSEIYQAAIRERRNICISDHPRLVTQYKDTRFTSWNIAGASAVADGRSIFKETPGIFINDELRKNSKGLVIKEIITAQQNPEQYSSVIALQEYDLDSIEEADLLSKLGPSWKIEKHDGGHVATLYDSNRFELLSEGKYSDPSDQDWRRVSLQLKDTKDGSFLTVHNAWADYNLTADRVREDMDKFSKERPSAIAKDVEHDSIFLMDLNKEVRRPTRGGPMQLVPAKYRSKIAGCADTDVAAIADAKGIHILPSRTYSPVAGTAALAIKAESAPHPDFSSYPPEVQEELQRMRGYTVFTAEDRAIKPDDKMDLITYQQHLRAKIGSKLVELGPAGNMLDESCFLQIRTAVTAELDRVGQAKFEGFHSYVKALVSQPSADPAAKDIECAEYQTGLNAQYVINVKTNQAMSVIDACLSDFSNLEKQLEVLQKDFPGVKLKLSCTRENKLCIQFEVDEEGNNGPFKGSAMNYLNKYQWPPISFTGNKLNISSVKTYFSEVRKVLTTLKLSASDKHNINKLKASLQEKTSDDNLRLSVICKPDEKNSVSYYIKLTGSYQAGYLKYLETKQKELGIVVYKSGIVHIPVEKIGQVVSTLEKWQPKSAAAENKQSGGKKLGDLFNEKLLVVDDSVKASITLDEGSMQGYVDETGAWLRYKPEEHGYFLSVLRAILGKEPATRSSPDGLFVSIPNDQLDTFLARLPGYYPQMDGIPFLQIQEELRTILEDGALSLTRKLENKECHYQLKTSSLLLSEEAREIYKTFDSVDGATLFSTYKIVESQKNNIVPKEHANVMKANWLKAKIPNSSGIKVISSLADGGKIILTLPFNAACFLAKKLGQQEGIRFKRAVVEEKSYIQIYCPRDKVAAFAAVLSKTFDRDAPVPLDGAPSLATYVTQLCDISKGDGSVEINPLINAAGDDVEYIVRLANAGMAADIATKIRVKNTGDQLIFPPDKLPAFNEAIKQYYAVTVFTGVPEDKSSSLNIGGYRQRLIGMGFVGLGLNLVSSDVGEKDIEVGDHKSVSPASSNVADGKERIAIYIPSDDFNNGFKTILEKAGKPYSFTGRSVTFPLNAVMAFDRMARQYVVSRKCKKEKTDALVSTLLSGLTANGQNAEADKLKEKRGSDSSSSTSVSTTGKADSKGGSPTFEDVLLYLLQPGCALNVDECWAAVKNKKIEKEAMRGMINDGITQLLQGKTDAEKLEIVTTICNPESVIHKLLVAKKRFGVGKRIDFIGPWQQEQAVLSAKIEHQQHSLRSASRLKEILGYSNDPKQIDELPLDEGYQALAGELMNLRKRYQLLRTYFIAEQRVAAKVLVAETSEADFVCLTREDLAKLSGEMLKAEEVFKQAYKASPAATPVKPQEDAKGLPQPVDDPITSSSSTVPPLSQQRPIGSGLMDGRPRAPSSVSGSSLPPPIPTSRPSRRPQGPGVGLLDQAGKVSVLSRPVESASSSSISSQSVADSKTALTVTAIQEKYLVSHENEKATESFIKVKFREKQAKDKQASISGLRGAGESQDRGLVEFHPAEEFRMGFVSISSTDSSKFTCCLVKAATYPQSGIEYCKIRFNPQTMKMDDASDDVQDFCEFIKKTNMYFVNSDGSEVLLPDVVIADFKALASQLASATSSEQAGQVQQPQGGAGLNC